jgi:hypothetical protein
MISDSFVLMCFGPTFGHYIGYDIGHDNDHDIGYDIGYDILTTSSVVYQGVVKISYPI